MRDLAEAARSALQRQTSRRKVFRILSGVVEFMIVVGVVTIFLV
jgi:hypothetical protein